MFVFIIVLILYGMAVNFRGDQIFMYFVRLLIHDINKSIIFVAPGF